MTSRLTGDWHVSVRQNGQPVLFQVLNCLTIWASLTKAQRLALEGHPARADVTARLVRRGLLDEQGAPTEAGRLVLKWTHPKQGARVGGEPE